MQETWAAMDVLCAASGQACMRFEAEGLAGQLVQELGLLTCAASRQACILCCQWAGLPETWAAWPCLVLPTDRLNCQA